MKKSRIGLFVLSLISCLSILLTSAVQVNAVTEYDSAWKPAIYAYNGFNNRLASGTIGYSDKILMIDARMEEPDPSIAKVSAALAAGAYRPTDEFNDNDDVNDTLKGMGYTILRNVNYDRQSSYLDNDFVAFTIASRQIQINGEDYVVYCIPVRGTDGREWYSDFNLGDTGNHEGFYTAAQEIFQVLEGIMNNDAYDTEHRILWITGHSRGAAVANIVEGEMTASADYALPEHIFGYNFACPSISRNESVTGTDFHNIFNFNNIGDLIPLLPMAEWGYTAYGQNLYLDVSQIDNVKFQIKNNSDRDYYAPMTPEGYQMSLNLIAAAEDSFHDKEMDIALFILAAYLGGDLNVNEGPLGLGRFLKTCFEKLGKDLNGDAMGTLLAIADFFVTTNSSVAAVAGLVAFLEESLKTLNGYRMEDNWEELISQWFAVTSNSEKLAEVSQYLMFYGIGTITTVSGVSLAYDQLKAVVDKYEKTAERIAGIMGLFYSTDGKLLEAFEYGHHPETYVTWINSMYLGYKGWNEYTDEIPVFKNIKSIDAYCFANVQKDVNPAFFNEDPSQIGYFGEMALYNNKITELTLYKETDYAGAKAFGDNKLLEKVTLPVDSLVTNTRAFSGCENIETLIYTPGETGIMPEQLDYYEEGKLLTDYRIESIAHNALKTLIYEEGVKELSARAGYGSYNAYGNGERLVAVGCERIDLPDSLEKIGDYAFDRISPEEFHLGPNLKEIGSYAFRFSKSRFTGSLDNLETVGDKAFYKTSIASDVLKLPGKVKKIGKNAFEGCTKLTGTIEILADQEFGDGAFYGCTGYRKLVLPVDFVYPRLSTGIHSYSSGEEWDGGTIFGECAIEEIEYKPGVTGIMTKIESSTSTYEDRNSSGHRAESTCRESLKRIIYDEGITEIAAYACYDNRYSPTSYTLTLDEIHLPSTLQKVGAYAFYQCGKPELIINGPIYPEEIGAYAFYDYDCLTPEIMPIPGKLKTFNAYVFYDCDNLMEEYTVVGDEKFGEYCFGSIDSLKKVTLPVDSLATNTRAFSGCENIETLIYTPGETGIMPEQLDYYEEGKLLTDYRIESIAHNALKTLIYEEGVKELSARAGYGSYNAYGNGERLVAVGCERIDLPDSLEKIGDYAFDRISPEEFHLGPNLKEIGSYAFRFSKSRFTGSLDNLETVGDKAFYKTSIASDVLKLPGKVKKIGKNAFEGCTKLTGTIEILADQEFGDGAFYGCTGYRKLVLPVDFVYPRLSTGIHSYSSGEEWDGGTIFGECAIEEIEYKPGVTGIMTKIESSTSTYEDRNSSGHRAESTCRESLKRIIYDEGITEIAAYACYDNRYSPTSYTLTLDEIHLPSTLQKVGAYAFYNTGLTEVYLPKAITEVGTNAFNSNPNLTLYVYRNTAAHNYAVNNKIPYVFMDPAATAILLPAEKEVMLGSTEQLNVTYTPEDATDPIFWVSSDESVVSIDENGNAKALSTGTAIITATTESGLTTQSVITVTSKGVSVYGSSLALEGKIGINFYLNIAEEELEYLNVAMTMNGQRMTVPASEGKASTVSGQKLRMFAYPVAAKEMRDKVTLTVEDADGNKIKLTKDETDYTEGYPFSASDYFARAEEAGTDRTKKLSRVLDNYGKYTQIYFDYHVTDDVLNIKDVSAVTLETLKPYQAVQTSTEVAGLTYVGGSTMLDDMIGYRLYFKIDASHQISDYTFTMDGEEVTPVKSGSQYYIEKTDIAARDLGNKNTIEVSDGNTTFGIQYCALSYAYRALELTAEDKIPLQNMCRAMYLYNQQAIEYFNS